MIQSLSYASGELGLDGDFKVELHEEVLQQPERLVAGVRYEHHPPTHVPRDAVHLHTDAINYIVTRK